MKAIEFENQAPPLIDLHMSPYSP